MRKGNEMNGGCKFYDHALNLRGAAGEAAARARRDAMASGNDYRVEFKYKGEWHYWNGCYYDALSLAKELSYNSHNYPVVLLLAPPRGEAKNRTAVNIKKAVY